MKAMDVYLELSSFVTLNLLDDGSARACSLDVEIRVERFQEDVMITKELIVKELGSLNENDLSELYRIIKGFIESKRRASPPSLMAKLKRVKIYAPTDFASNLDLYMSGDKSAG